jgi:Uma2 family endonuclease
MATILSDRTYTPEDLLTMPEGKRFELVEGRLVEAEMSALACRIVLLVAKYVTAFVEERQLGSVFSSELGYRCFAEDRTRIRRPDLSYISRGRLRPEHLTGFVPIPPDLAIEVVSEHDLYYEVEEKVEEYLRAGVRLVWVFNPQRRAVRVYRADRSVSEVAEGGVLSGEAVLPGLELPVQPLFALPPMNESSGLAGQSTAG